MRNPAFTAAFAGISIFFHSLEEVHWTTGFCVQASLMLGYRNQTPLQPSKTWPWILSANKHMSTSYEQQAPQL